MSGVFVDFLTSILHSMELENFNKNRGELTAEPMVVTVNNILNREKLYY